MSGTTTYARGVAKTICMAEETGGFGVASTNPGALIRRTQGNIDLNVSAIQSQEILQSQQVRDWRQGPRQVSGSISGQLSAATYKLFFEGLFRARFTTQVVVSPTDLQFTETTAQTEAGIGNQTTFPCLSSPTVNFWVNGFRTGDVIGITSLPSNIAAEDGDRLEVTGFQVGGNVMLVSPSQTTAFPPIAGTTGPISATVQTAGFKCVAASSNQQYLSYTFEQYYADIQYSEVFTGCRITQISISVPPTGFVTFQASITGQNGTAQSGGARYPTPSPETATTSLTMVSGAILYAGVALTYITSLNVQIQVDTQADPVVGSNVVPDIFQGTLMVRGTLTCFMPNDALANDFLTENVVSLSLMMTATNQDGVGDFINLYMPTVKLASYTKTDSDRAIVRSFSFVALEQGAPYCDDTSISIMDSAAQAG